MIPGKKRIDKETQDCDLPSTSHGIPKRENSILPDLKRTDPVHSVQESLNTSNDAASEQIPDEDEDEDDLGKTDPVHSVQESLDTSNDAASEQIPDEDEDEDDLGK
ncbi:hypothetical protein QYM36_018589 [Artemia franciscana]|uniref:Uncharacterized protein n=1 Tax=Artemia franciscana TaxID=6661 RepID=A0AA88HCJ2_ARTSF|nr:hypothetical protein QYM36_018589 [Artemia franciscana]